ncbi:MAG: Ig-like domain-containing protein, partial [Bacteroidales bacterium]
MRITLLLTILILITFSGCKKDQSIPNQSPLVQFINPLAIYTNATLSMEDTLNIMANATDNDGEVKSVQFYLDGVLLANDNESPWNHKILFEEEGYYILSLTAMDNNNNTSDTALN